jgi:hypothetical protein
MARTLARSGDKVQRQMQKKKEKKVSEDQCRISPGSASVAKIIGRIESSTNGRSLQWPMQSMNIMPLQTLQQIR